MACNRAVAPCATARWEVTAELVAAGLGSVLGNGDVFTAADAPGHVRAHRLRRHRHRSRVLGRPWLFGQLDDALSGRPVGRNPPWARSSDTIGVTSL